MDLINIHFILSQPRSGSTLFRLILSKAENFISLPETHFFPFRKENIHLTPTNVKHREKIANNWINYFTIKKMQLNCFDLKNAIISNGSSWKDIFEITLEEYRKTNYPNISHPIYIEKSPPHIFFVDEIRELYPSSKIIHLIRDPRSVIASLRNMSWATSNIYTLSRSWVKSNELLENKKDTILIRYEDLVKNTDKVILKMVTFLEIKNTIAEYSSGFTDHVERKNWNSDETSKPINSDNLEKWKGMLSIIDGEVQIIENICSYHMKKYGYQLLNLKKNNGYYSLYFASSIQFIFLKLLRNIFK